MTSTKSAPPGEAAPGILPVLYKAPVVLRFDRHRRNAIRPSSGYGFSAGTLAVPLLVGEFAHAARYYPIVFGIGDTPAPLALLGLKEGQNLFLRGDGSWLEGVYVPAYLRRYPFIVTEIAESGQQLLAVDAACDRFTSIGAAADAEPLFDDKGGPSPAAGRALAFCRAFHEDHLRGEAFVRALKEHDLLAPRQASMRFPDESRYRLDGFLGVDEAKFRALDDAALIADWHRKGWLAAVDLHLSSMLSWENLMRLNAQRETGQQDVA